MMTPHRWKVRNEALQRLEALNELEVTIDVVLHQFGQSL